MKMQHLLIEGYCDGKEGEKGYPCQSTLTLGLHCLGCSQFSYTKCPNEIAVTNEEGLINGKDFIGFGGEMEPKDLKKRDEYISIWNDICRKKLNEAYDEYFNTLLHMGEL